LEPLAARRHLFCYFSAVTKFKIENLEGAQHATALGIFTVLTKTLIYRTLNRKKKNGRFFSRLFCLYFLNNPGFLLRLSVENY